MLQNHFLQATDIDSFIFRATASDADQIQEIIYNIVGGNIVSTFIRIEFSIKLSVYTKRLEDAFLSFS